MATRGIRKALAASIESLMLAQTATELEEAFRRESDRLIEHYGGRIFDKGCIRTQEHLRIAGMKARGRQLADASPYGDLIPRLGSRRRLHLAGEQFSVGFGGNSAGERYAWYAADDWCRARLAARSVPEDTIRLILEWWAKYPHRALRALEENPPQQRQEAA